MLYLVLFSAEEFSVFLGGGFYSQAQRYIIVQFIIRVLNLFLVLFDLLFFFVVLPSS